MYVFLFIIQVSVFNYCFEIFIEWIMKITVEITWYDHAALIHILHLITSWFNGAAVMKKVSFRPKSQTKLKEIGLMDFNFENRLWLINKFTRF